MDKIKDILYRLWFLSRTRAEKWLIIGGLSCSVFGLIAMVFVMRYIERPADIVINCDMDRIFGGSSPATNTRLDMTDIDVASTPERSGRVVGDQAQGLTKDHDPDSKVDKAGKTTKTNKNDTVRQKKKPKTPKKTQKSTKVSKPE